VSGKPNLKPIRNSHIAFSAIEVLVCIALIGLLTAIALPRFERAHVSANVSQARADLQALKVGLESYKTDRGAYPWQNASTACLKEPSLSGLSSHSTLERLSTPISYLNGETPFYEAFPSEYYYSGPSFSTIIPSPSPANLWYRYNARNARDTSTWGQSASHDVDPYWYFLESSGPDKHYHMTWERLNSMTTETALFKAMLLPLIYDPTNGAISRGSIWVVGGEPQGYGTSMATVINEANSSRVSGWGDYGK